MRKGFRGFNIDVLVVFRRPDAFAESLYSEAISRDLYRGDFCSFLSQWDMLFDYDRHIREFARVGSVLVRQYSPTAALATVTEAIGIELPHEAHQFRIRASADPRLVLWMARQDPEHRKTQKEFAGTPAATEALGTAEPSTLWEPAAREAFLREHPVNHPDLNFDQDLSPVSQVAVLTGEVEQRLTAAYREWRSL